MPLGSPAGDYGFVSRAFEFWYDIIVIQFKYVAYQICYEDLTIETYFILVFADFNLSFQLCTWLFCRRSCRVRCVACIGVSRYLTTQEVSAALRPFYFIVHPDLFGQFPNERVCKLHFACVCVCVCMHVCMPPKGRLGMSDVTLLFGISGLSFDSPFLSPLFVFSCLVLLLFLSSDFSANGPFSWLFFQKTQIFR